MAHDTPSLIITADLNDDGLILEAEGELDLITAAQLREVVTSAIASALHPIVTVDLRQVTVIDSYGLAVLIRARSAAQKADVRLVVAVLKGGTADRVLKKCSLDAYLNISYSLDPKTSSPV